MQSTHPVAEYDTRFGARLQPFIFIINNLRDFSNNARHSLNASSKSGVDNYLPLPNLEDDELESFVYPSLKNAVHSGDVDWKSTLDQKHPTIHDYLYIGNLVPSETKAVSEPNDQYENNLQNPEWPDRQYPEDSIDPFPR